MAIFSCHSLILLVLALASVARAYTLTSPGPSATPRDRILQARQPHTASDPGPSAVYYRGQVLQARQPLPSQIPARSLRRKQLNMMTSSELAEAICPGDLYGCPIAEAGSLSSLPTSFADWQEQGFECVDLGADLKACGGCASLNANYDCTKVVGANDVSCVTGACIVDSCKAGYTLDSGNNNCLQ